jgi:ATP-dependent Clp protease ATP-binding subunit ClpB
VELEQVQRRGDLHRASEIQYGKLPELQGQLDALKEKQSQGGLTLLKEEVTQEDIAKVVSSWTGIPVSRLQEGERQKLVKMEERLMERVVGQEQAIKGWVVGSGFGVGFLRR